MGLLSWIAVGAATGVLARLALSGGVWLLILLGVSGASFGGLVFGIFGGEGTMDFDARSIPAALLGAVVLISFYRLISGRAI